MDLILLDLWNSKALEMHEKGLAGIGSEDRRLNQATTSI